MGSAWPCWLLCAVAVARVSADPAPASAVRASDDAFGTILDLDAVGLYGDSDARGFSPLDAGNVRIEGLYFDMKTSQAAATDLDPCWVGEAGVRVGLAAQAFAFPAPSGIVDVKLDLPGAGSSLSAEATRGPFRFGMAMARGQAPLGGHAAIGACLAGYRDFAPDYYERARHASGAFVGHWEPREGLQLLPFAYVGEGDASGQKPRVYGDGLTVPVAFDNVAAPTQSFTQGSWRQLDAGLVARGTGPGGTRWRAGVFHSREADGRYDVEQWLDLGAQGIADHVLDVVPPNEAASTSGEVQLARPGRLLGLEAEWRLTVRGRSARQSFGGDALIDYGPVSIAHVPSWGPAPYVLGPATRDTTRQWGVGGELYAHEGERWSASLGALRTRYERDLATGDGSASHAASSPTLVDLRAQRRVARGLDAYASYVQGLEDAALAPDSAVNRGEPPPASRSRQADAGLRWATGDSTSVIVGVFDVSKPFLSLDAGGTYRALGSVRHRGVEASFVGDVGSCRSLLGFVWLRARHDPVADLPGDTPLGTTPLTAQLRADCSPPGWHGFSLTAGTSYWGRRPASFDGRAQLPALAVLDAGLRYEATVAGHALALRLDCLNAADARGLHVTDVVRLEPELGRRFSLKVSLGE